MKATAPKRNRPFWIEKFEANRDRDAAALRSLDGRGFALFTVWECQLADGVVNLHETVEAIAAGQRV